MEAILYLTTLGVILLLGLLTTLISNKLRISNVLLLTILGIILWYFNGASNNFFILPEVFLVGLSILTLAMLVFDGSSRFKMKDLDQLYIGVLKLTGLNIILNILILTPIITLLFFGSSIEGLPYALIFAILMSATDAGSVFTIFKDREHKIIRYLEVEAVVNTPLTVLLPFIVLDFLQTGTGFLTGFVNQIMPFLQQIFVGVGAGLVIGIIVLRVLKNVYNDKLSPIGLLVAAILSYTLAEQLGGNGVLAVAVLGLMFGNFYVKQKGQLQEFSSILSNSLEILVFVLIGISIYHPLPLSFYAKSLIAFLCLIAIRYLAVRIGMRKEKINQKQTIFMTLNIPKGIAVAVVALTFSSMTLYDPSIIPAHRETLLSLILSFLVFSLIVASIIERYAHKFLHIPKTNPNKTNS